MTSTQERGPSTSSYVRSSPGQQARVAGWHCGDQRHSRLSSSSDSQRV